MRETYGTILVMKRVVGFFIITLTFVFAPWDYAYAQVKIELPTIVIKPCAIKAAPLKDGLRKGILKGDRPFLYVGPSVICDSRGKLQSNTNFIVTGSSKSTFGKDWYEIELLNSGKSAWIPSKYVTLGARYTRPKKKVANTPSPTPTPKPAIVNKVAPVVTKPDPCSQVV